MRNEVKYIASIFVLGMSLVAYANEKFMTRDIGQMIFDSLVRIEKKIDDTNKRIDELYRGGN